MAACNPGGRRKINRLPAACGPSLLPFQLISTTYLDCERFDVPECEQCHKHQRRYGHFTRFQGTREHYRRQRRKDLRQGNVQFTDSRPTAVVAGPFSETTFPTTLSIVPRFSHQIAIRTEHSPLGVLDNFSGFQTGQRKKHPRRTPTAHFGSCLRTRLTLTQERPRSENRLRLGPTSPPVARPRATLASSRSPRRWSPLPRSQCTAALRDCSQTY